MVRLSGSFILSLYILSIDRNSDVTLTHDGHILNHGVGLDRSHGIQGHVLLLLWGLSRHGHGHGSSLRWSRFCLVAEWMADSVTVLHGEETIRVSTTACV